MASQFPPKKNTAYTFYVDLIDQTDTRRFKTNPTLAAGDVMVSIDGGAFANLTTLPDAEPNGGKGIRVQLSAAEMNGDNIQVLFSDVAGSEWCDYSVNIQTVGQTLDEMMAVLTTIGGYLETEIASIISTLSTIVAQTNLIPASPAAVGSEMTLASGALNDILTTLREWVLNESADPGTYEEAQVAARAQGFGRWRIVSGSPPTFELYGVDGTTVIKTFELDSLTVPRERAPQ